MARLKIVLVGGGSVTWTHRIVKDMMLTKSLSDAEFVLYDIDKKASDLNKLFLDKLKGILGTKAKIVSTDNRARAFKGAQYVVITISTGRLKSVAHDLAIPEDYSIYHTVGDTSGPGGWARLIRNFDPIVSLALAINRYAPGAFVLNYTNPMTALTDVLSRLCDGPVIGLCHGLFENLAFIQKYYRLNSEEELDVNYAGVNHFFWITQATAKRKDVVADLTKKVKRRSLTDLLKEAYEDELGYKSYREVATELFRLTDVMPYLGDRHTCEFFPWYITNRHNMKKYKIERTTTKQRQATYRQAERDLRKMIKGDIPSEYTAASRETAANIISAHFEGNVFIDVGNVPNIGQVSNLPLGAVLETAVRVDRHGVSPIAFGALPEVVRAMVEPWTNVFTMSVDACFQGDKHMALQALRLDPLCSHLNTEQVNEMGNRLLTAHKRYITAF